MWEVLSCSGRSATVLSQGWVLGNIEIAFTVPAHFNSLRRGFICQEKNKCLKSQAQNLCASLRCPRASETKRKNTRFVTLAFLVIFHFFLEHFLRRKCASCHTSTCEGWNLKQMRFSPPHASTRLDIVFTCRQTKQIENLISFSRKTPSEVLACGGYKLQVAFGVCVNRKQFKEVQLNCLWRINFSFINFRRKEINRKILTARLMSTTAQWFINKQTSLSDLFAKESRVSMWTEAVSTAEIVKRWKADNREIPIWWFTQWSFRELEQFPKPCGVR